MVEHGNTDSQDALTRDGLSDEEADAFVESVLDNRPDLVERLANGDISVLADLLSAVGKEYQKTKND